MIWTDLTNTYSPRASFPLRGEGAQDREWFKGRLIYRHNFKDPKYLRQLIRAIKKGPQTAKTKRDVRRLRAWLRELEQ